jgi:outer membrane cobalamin receptor
VAPWLYGWLGLASAADHGRAEDEPLENLLDLFDDRVDQAASVADKTARSQREASALVTVITGEELRVLGARDLMDALRLIPSVDFASDLWNTTTLLVRGGIGERVLVLIDGHVWNEAYGSTTFGHRLPATLIDRIEVIRGPGSAVYGGTAEVAVVRVTTKSSSIEGVQIDARTSFLPSGVYGHQDLSLSAGGALGTHGHVGVSTTFGRGRRTDDLYRDVRGHEVDLTDASALDPALISGDLTWGGLQLALAAERYATTWQDGGVHTLRHDHDNSFSGLYGRASWTGPLSRSTLLRGYGQYKIEEPWHSTRGFPEDAFGTYRDRDDKVVGGFELRSQPHDRLELQGGLEGGSEHARSFEPGAQPHTRHLVGSGWSQFRFDLDGINVLAGTRLDTSTAYRYALSPRLVVSEAWRRFHYKAALNRAFRAPNVLQSQYHVLPETMTTLELEGGAGPTAWSYVTASAFHNQLSDPIVYRYFFDEVTQSESEGYVNGPGMATMGLEADLQLLLGPFTCAGGLALVRAQHPPVDYEVPGQPSRVLAVPAQKAVVRAMWDPGERLTLGAVGTWLGTRWALDGLQGETPVYSELPPSLMLDLSAEMRHVGVRGLSVGLQVHDLLDHNPPFIQAYNGWHAPLPGQGREIGVQLTWER